MRIRLRNENLTWIRTRFNARSFVLIAMSILMCAGIAGCDGGPDTVPGAFALLSPSNGATGVSLTPALSWTDADGETSYTMEIDDENTFSSPLVYQDTGIAAGTTGFVVPGGVLASGTTYYWRVIAVNSEGSTTASNAPFSFTVAVSSSGALVQGFGPVGAVTSDPSSWEDEAFAIAIDTTAMYVVGYDGSPGEDDGQWRIETRSLTDGSPLPGFGTDGVVTSDPSTRTDKANAIAIDTTAMYVVGYDGSPGQNDDQWRIEKRSLTDGSLVPGFGTDGVVTSNPSTSQWSYDAAEAVAVDSTAMYVVGYDRSPEHDHWRIEKRGLTDGDLVLGFGTGGVVTSDNSTGHAQAYAIAIDSTAMYVVGYDYSPGNRQWRIEKRYLTDGDLVPGFGTGGVVTTNPSTPSDGAYAIAIDSTAMYVVGYDESPGNIQWRIEKRSLTDGDLVTGFGDGGVILSDPSESYDQALNIAIDSTAMYVVGFDDSPGNPQWRIEKRSLTDGGLVPVFGTGGAVTTNPSTSHDWAHAIAIDSTAIYVVGFDGCSEPLIDLQWRIEKRSLTDGGLVTGFGAGGTVTSDPSTGVDAARAIAIGSTAMYVVGYDHSHGNPQWRIEKRSLTDGGLVSGFGTGGIVTSDPSTGGDVAYAIAIGSTAMYVVGYDESPGLGDSQWRIEKRSLADGSLVTGFGAGGTVTSDPSMGYDAACGIAIDSTAMYVVGYDESPGNSQWRIEKRSLTDGSLVPEFGTGGVVTSDPGVGSDMAWDSAIDSTCIYVVGYDDSPGNRQWRIEKRSLMYGGLVGIYTSNPSTGSDEAYDIAIDSTAMYVVGYDCSPGDYQWRTEKRSLTDGSLVPGFGTGGVVTSNPSTVMDNAYSIAIDSAAMYLVGYDSSPGNRQWRIEKRGLTDGSLVPEFGTGGVVTSDPSTGANEAYNIAIDSTAIYVVGYDCSHGEFDYQWRIEKRFK